MNITTNVCPNYLITAAVINLKSTPFLHQIQFYTQRLTGDIASDIHPWLFFEMLP